jgi:hypothetical protein
MSGHAPGGGVTPGAPPVDRATPLWTLPSGREVNPGGNKTPFFFSLALSCGARAAGHSSEIGVPLVAGSEIRQLGVGFTIVCSCGVRLGWSSRVDATAEVFVSEALWIGMPIKRTAHGQEEPSEFIL